MRGVRPSWYVVIAVAALIVAAKPLRDEGQVPLAAVLAPRSLLALFPDDGPRLTSEDCVRFVERRHPKDPQMLLAAAALCLAEIGIPEAADNPRGRALKEKALSLLDRATGAGGGPACWAGVVNALLFPPGSFEGYPWLADTAVDPTDPAEVAGGRKDLSDLPQPKEPPERTAKPLLEALREWQQSDPQNGLPLALESVVLYGLRRDEAALAFWLRASRLPTASDRAEDARRAVRLLLARMKVPGPVAVMTSLTIPATNLQGMLRHGARIAVFEGRRASMDGRAREAVALWNGTVDLGDHMQQSAVTLVEYLASLAITGVGGAPAWRWVTDETSGIPGGPLQQGRYFHGPQHAFYVRQVGGPRDAELRDQLARSKIRVALIHSVLERTSLGIWLDITFWHIDLILVAFAAWQLVILLLLFAVVSAWSRRAADDATTLNTHRQLAMGLLAALGVLPGVVASLIAAPFSRRKPATVLAAWRGNLRAALPKAAALTAVVYLALCVVAARAHARSNWTMTGTEMQRFIQLAGPSWGNPSIPPDAWRAKPPPKVTPRQVR